jgi:hypothetical protein
MQKSKSKTDRIQENQPRCLCLELRAGAVFGVVRATSFLAEGVFPAELADFFTLPAFTGE